MPKRKKFIVGNWKMNKTPSEAVHLARSLKVKVSDIRKTKIGVCPPFVDLHGVVESLKDSNILVGAQNVSHLASGALTGEVSAPMIRDAGCRYVIIGHSERRQFFGESDETVNAKIKLSLTHELLPIVCVGETLDQRNANVTFEVIDKQVQVGLSGLTTQQASLVTLAYEPVWAIGTGKNATVAEADEVHRFIRRQLTELFGSDVAEKIVIQYGGSVKAENAASLLSCEEIDGALVGGASLDPDGFAAIVRAADAHS